MMTGPARKGGASKKPIRADRSHRDQPASKTTGVRGKRAARPTPSRAGWRQQPAAENAPRMSADEILQQYLASPVGSPQARKLMQQYRAATASGQLVETTDTDTEGGD